MQNVYITEPPPVVGAGVQACKPAPRPARNTATPPPVTEGTPMIDPTPMSSPAHARADHYSGRLAAVRDQAHLTELEVLQIGLDLDLDRRGPAYVGGYLAAAAEAAQAHLTALAEALWAAGHIPDFTIPSVEGGCEGVQV